MTRRYSTSFLALSFILVSRFASAQTVGVAINGGTGAPGVSGASARVNGGSNSFQFQPLSTKVGLTGTPTFSRGPALAAPRPTVGATLVPAANQEGVHADVISLVEGFALPAAPGSLSKAVPQAEGPKGVSLGALEKAVVPEAKAQAQAPEWSIKRLFDGMVRRRDIAVQAGPVKADAPVASRTAVLAKAVPAMSAPKAEVAAPEPSQPAKPRGFARAAAAIAIGALVIGLSTIAMAATAPAAAAVGSVAFIASIHPLATALSAAVGAAYGMFSAKGKDGAAPSTGEVMTSVLRYGLLAGAGTFILLDLTQAAFFGFATLAAKPIPFSLATAALGQSAFQGKFADPATTSADRVMATFPAVAAALGLGATVFFAGLTLPFAAAITAMSLTGVAAAVFAALYKPGVSSPDAPAKMAKGFVLQSLMSGLALSVAAPYLAIPLAAMAAWGFLSIWSTALAELETALPESIRGLWRR